MYFQTILYNLKEALESFRGIHVTILEMEQGVSPEQEGSESVTHYLERLSSSGFLFHGSNSNDISVLEPRFTLDLDSEDNTDTAVFATSNVTWATIFGVHGKYKGWSTSIRKGKVIAKIQERDREKVENAIGTVYVLSNDSFKKSGEYLQFKSHEPVIPLTKVSVTLQDYYDLGGEVEWVK